MKCKQFLSVVLALSMSLSNLIIPLSASAEDINDVTEFQNYDGITNEVINNEMSSSQLENAQKLLNEQNGCCIYDIKIEAEKVNVKFQTPVECKLLVMGIDDDQKTVLSSSEMVVMSPETSKEIYISNIADACYIQCCLLDEKSLAPISAVFYSNMYTDDQNVKYQVFSDHAEVIGLSSSHEPLDIILPDKINGVPVTIIHANSFSGTNIKSIVIPENVTSIGECAFSECRSLTDATISDSVKSIGYMAFYECNSLKTVKLPSNIEKLSGSLFNGCSSLEKVIIPDSVTEIGNYVFSGCESLTEILIPSSVTFIGDAAFGSCLSLSSITIPDSVTTIESSIFYNCQNLKSIDLPDGLTSISNCMFESCSSLTHITLPDSIENIGFAAFVGCTSLTDFTIPHKLKKISSNMLNSTSITEITIPDGIESIEFAAFSDCTKLKKIIIPESVTFIDEEAFLNCSSLTEISLPYGIKEIGYETFGGCSSLTYIDIPESVEKIDKWAFSDCVSLSAISFSPSLIEIDYSSFDGCTSLADIYYSGSEQEWNSSQNQNVSYYFENIKEAAIHYNTNMSSLNNSDFQNVQQRSHQLYMAQNPVETPTIQPDSIKKHIPPEYSKKEIENTIIETDFTALLPNTIYNVYELKDTTKGASSNNLLYFEQLVSDENGHILVDASREGAFAVKAKRTLFNPVITVPEVFFDGTEMFFYGTDQEIVPTVTVDGINLVKDVDYIISGDSIINGFGMYLIYIEGINEWSGIENYLLTVDNWTVSTTTTSNNVTTDKITEKTDITNTTTVNVSSTTTSIHTDITTESSLPQTGNNSFTTIIVWIMSFVLIIFGSFTLIYFFRKEDDLKRTGQQKY